MIDKHYSIRDLFAMEACTNCRLCAEVCPAVLASDQGMPPAPASKSGMRPPGKAR